MNVVGMGDAEMKVIVVGPDGHKTRGGIASVLQGMRENTWLTEKTGMDFFSSYYEGNIVLKILYGVWRILLFNFVVDRYDLVHIHMSIKGSAQRKMRYAKIAKRHGKKLVLHIHSGNFVVYYKNLPPEKQKEVKDCLESADRVFALSECWKTAFEQELGLTNCEVMPNGISVKKFPLSEKPFAERKIDFLFLGRLGEQKGTDDTLGALERLHNEGREFRCVMAGDGPLEEYSAQIKQKGLTGQVELVGWVGGEKKSGLLQDSKILLLPSYYEGLPMSILEAMASEEAVVSTPVGGIPEAVKVGESGILITPGDAESLYNALRDLLDDTAKAEQMGRYGRKIVEEKYDLEKLHRQLYAEYCKILGV